VVYLVVKNGMASIKLVLLLCSLQSTKCQGKLTLSMPGYIAGVELKLYSFLASTLIGDELSASRRGCFTAGIHLNLDT
jgi:hypothetical protein